MRYLHQSSAAAFLTASILLGAEVTAEPAIFTNGTLTIDNGAVISEQGNSYYSNIQLIQNEDRTFSVVAAQEQPLVMVDNVDVAIMESFPVQVSLNVSGNLSVPCVELNEPAVSFENNTFTVVLSETVLGPAETCITVLEPFETNIALDVLGLSAGTYTVDVNGLEAEFTLEVDNTPLP